MSLEKDIGEWVAFKANRTTVPEKKQTTHLSCSVVSAAKKETPERLCAKNKDSNLDAMIRDISLINFVNNQFAIY